MLSSGRALHTPYKQEPPPWTPERSLSCPTPPLLPTACSSFNYVGDIGQPVLATHQITKLKPIFEKIEVSTAQMYPKVRGTARDDGVIGKSRYKSDPTSVLKRRSIPILNAIRTLCARIAREPLGTGDPELYGADRTEPPQ